jgi:hypothetical protein
VALLLSCRLTTLRISCGRKARSFEFYVPRRANGPSFSAERGANPPVSCKRWLGGFVPPIGRERRFSQRQPKMIKRIGTASWKSDRTPVN